MTVNVKTTFNVVIRFLNTGNQKCPCVYVAMQICCRA